MEETTDMLLDHMDGNNEKNEFEMINYSDNNNCQTLSERRTENRVIHGAHLRDLGLH